MISTRRPSSSAPTIFRTDGTAITFAFRLSRTSHERPSNGARLAAAPARRCSVYVLPTLARGLEPEASARRLTRSDHPSGAILGASEPPAPPAPTEDEALRASLHEAECRAALLEQELDQTESERFAARDA